MAGTNQKAYNVCIRVPVGIKEKIDKDIMESGEFSSASQWYLAAVREYLEKRESVRMKKEGLGGGGLTNLKAIAKNNWGVTAP